MASTFDYESPYQKRQRLANEKLAALQAAREERNRAKNDAINQQERNFRSQQIAGASQSFGQNATETNKLAQESASGLARDTAEKVGGMATSGAMRGARTAGLSKAQAAQVGAGQTGNAIMGSYLQDLSQNKANYLRAAEGFQQGALGLGSLSNQRDATQVQREGIQAQTASANAQLAQQKQQWEADQGWRTFSGILGGVGAFASGIGAIFSDKEVKHDLSSGYGMLEHVTSKVKPYLFKYNKSHETGKPETERLGVMAQDLEQSPLEYVVEKDQDGVKRVDAGQLTMANTAMISELAQKVDKALQFLKNRG